MEHGAGNSTSRKVKDRKVFFYGLITGFMKKFICFRQV